MPAPRRLHGERGAIIAEAALLTPFFVTLLFGMLEFGGAFRDYLTTANASANAARQAAIQGNNQTADWYILKAIQKTSSAMPSSQIQTVVIYKATGANDTGPTSACKTASVASTCNYYSASMIQTAFAAATAPLSYQTCNAGDPEASWCPTTRSVVVTGTGPDYVGVWIKVSHPWITGMFGQSLTLTSTSVIQLEPQKLNIGS
jgi:Flp pilus assembly protein TadG